MSKFQSHKSLSERFSYYEKKKANNIKPWDKHPQYCQESLSPVRIEITDEFFYNDHGCIRWDNIRNAYFNNHIDVDRVTDLFIKWRDQLEYLWLDGYDANKEYVSSIFVKAAKRGNDVYKKRLKEKFDFLEQLDPVYFFGDWGDRKTTPMIFVTLTVDPKKYSLDNAWKSISKELHIFETLLRQKYGTYKCNCCNHIWIGRSKCPNCKAILKAIKCVGSFVKFRVWESHVSGYPHVHIVFYFHDNWFHVFKHKDLYRISTKNRNIIRDMWSMGNVDIQGVQDTHGAFKEVKKYITKTVWNKKGDLTNAMICLHNKQMYWISQCDPYNELRKVMDIYHEIYEDKLSTHQWIELENDCLDKGAKSWIKKDFIGSIWGESAYIDFYKNGGVVLAEPNTTALVKDSLHNCNIEIPEIVYFKFVGVVLHADVKKFVPEIDESWVIIADPPPDLAGHLGFLHRDISLPLYVEDSIDVS